MPAGEHVRVQERVEQRLLEGQRAAPAGGEHRQRVARAGAVRVVVGVDGDEQVRPIGQLQLPRRAEAGELLGGQRRVPPAAAELELLQHPERIDGVARERQAVSSRRQPTSNARGGGEVARALREGVARRYRRNVTSWVSAAWRRAPRPVRLAVGALVTIVVTLPLLAAVDYAMEPEALPSAGLTRAQIGAVIALLLVLAIGWLLLLALLLLRRSRVGWVLVVLTGVGTVVPPRSATGSPASAVAALLTVVSFLPLLAPESLRWFWVRPGTRQAAPRLAPDLRRPD